MSRTTGIWRFCARVSSETDPQRVIEGVLGPIHLRLLLTGEPVDRTFLEAIVDTIVDGIAIRGAT